MFSIELLHSFDFSKNDSITIIKTMPFLLVKINSSCLIFTNSRNVYGFLLLTGRVYDFVFLSEVHKSESIKA